MVHKRFQIRRRKSVASASDQAHPSPAATPCRAAQLAKVLATGGETQNNVGKFSITASAGLYTP